MVFQNMTKFSHCHPALMPFESLSLFSVWREALQSVVNSFWRFALYFLPSFRRSWDALWLLAELISYCSRRRSRSSRSRFPRFPSLSATLFLTVWCRTDEKILCRALLCGPLATRAWKPCNFADYSPSKLYQA